MGKLMKPVKHREKLKHSVVVIDGILRMKILSSNLKIQIPPIRYFSTLKPFKVGFLVFSEKLPTFSPDFVQGKKKQN